MQSSDDDFPFFLSSDFNGAKQFLIYSKIKQNIKVWDTLKIKKYITDDYFTKKKVAKCTLSHLIPISSSKWKVPSQFTAYYVSHDTKSHGFPRLSPDKEKLMNLSKRQFNETKLLNMIEIYQLITSCWRKTLSSFNLCSKIVKSSCVSKGNGSSEICLAFESVNDKQ